MPGGEMGDVLRQRHIVLIHEDAFILQYLADVIARSGGVVARPIGADVDAALAGAAALVLSDTAPRRDAIVSSASERGVPLLIVRSARRNQTLATTDRVLTVPFAGFQVVEMLCDLLQQQEMLTPAMSGPCSRAH